MFVCFAFFFLYVYLFIQRNYYITGPTKFGRSLKFYGKQCIFDVYDVKCKLLLLILDYMGRGDQELHIGTKYNIIEPLL